MLKQIHSLNQVQRTRLLVIVAVNLLAIAIRIFFIQHSPIQVDEVKIIEESLNFHWNAIPVQFIGYGNGEYLPVPLLARILIQFCQWDPLIAIRGIVFMGNMLFINLLYLLCQKLFDARTALVAILFAAIWPWSIVAGSVGYSFFLVPAIITAIMLLLYCYAEKQQPWLPMFVGVLLAALCYTYPIGFVWSLLIMFVAAIALRKRLKIVHVIAALVAFIVLIFPLVLFYFRNQFGIVVPDQLLFLRILHLPASRFDQITVLTGAGLFGVANHVVTNYLIHFNYWLLSYVIGSGNLFSYLTYVWDVAFIYAGLYFIVKQWHFNKVVMAWLLLYPLGSSITAMNEYGYFMSRDIAGLPILISVSAYGCVMLASVLRKHRKQVIKVAT